MTADALCGQVITIFDPTTHLGTAPHQTTSREALFFLLRGASWFSVFSVAKTGLLAEDQTPRSQNGWHNGR
jgi:hypothetical protein